MVTSEVVIDGRTRTIYNSIVSASCGVIGETKIVFSAVSI